MRYVKCHTNQIIKKNTLLNVYKVHIVINLETNLNYNSENKDKISDRVCVYLQLTETSSSSGVQSPLTNINEHTSMEKQLQT